MARSKFALKLFVLVLILGLALPASGGSWWTHRHGHSHESGDRECGDHEGRYHEGREHESRDHEDRDHECDEHEQPKVQIAIKEAYYLDADHDGNMDDTYTRIELDFSGAERYTFDYQLTLTLPSGEQFKFDWILGTKLNGLNIGTTMYNTAIEQGWYTIHLQVGMYTGGLNYSEVNHEFDPPGGTSGTRPYAMYAFL